MHGSRSPGLGAIAIAALLLPACDLDVQNPGRIEDKFAQQPEAQSAMLNGAGRAVAQGLNWVGYTGAAVSREIHPSGSTGTFGINNFWQRGVFEPNDEDLNTHWEQTQRARWMAEETVRRIEASGEAKAGNLAQANLWAGYANRILGENMCKAVIDGGPEEPNSGYFERAVAYFTKAAQGSGDVATAARAGRAAAYVHLGKWTEAAADAAQVPTSFKYEIRYFDIGDDPQRNRIMFASANRPYRAHTVWNTVNEKYFEQTGDARVKYRKTTLTGDAAIECCGRVPWYPQEKYTSSASPIRLSSGPEMRLIEAEARLRAGDLSGALALINAVRANAKAAGVVAVDITDAWTKLKRERGIELWLEGRRLGDLRRWQETNTPGALDPLETPGPLSHLDEQDLCFPTARSERETNPNIS